MILVMLLKMWTGDIVCPFTFKFILTFFCLYLYIQVQEDAERNSIQGSCIAWDTALCVLTVHTEHTIYSCLSHLLALECFKIAWIGMVYLSITAQ